MTPLSDATLDQLRDRAWLEQAICDMGLADNIGIYPEHLQRYAGGLYIWQYPCQLAPYLIWLSDKGIKSYCEIGVAYGGTLAVTVEYLNRFTPLEHVLVIDDNSMLLGYRAQEIIASLPVPTHAVWARSDSWEARTAINIVAPELVLIDAMHTEDACRADYELVRDVAKCVAFHDIVEWSCPGVAKVWAGIDGNKVEFTEQCGMSMSFFGLGVTW